MSLETLLVKYYFTALKPRGYSMIEMRALKHDIWFNYTDKFQFKAPWIPIILDYCSTREQLGKNYSEFLKKEKIINNYKIVVAYKQNKNLKQLLTRSRLENTKQEAFRGCGLHNCKTCKIHSFDCVKIHSGTINHDYNIVHDLSCSSSRLVYFIICAKC